MPSQPQPLSLTDDQMAAVMRAARALQLPDRDPFLRALAHRLRGEVIGDGLLHRVMKELLRPGGGFFHPPSVASQPKAKLSASKLKGAPAITVDAE